MSLELLACRGVLRSALRIGITFPLLRDSARIKGQMGGNNRRRQPRPTLADNLRRCCSKTWICRASPLTIPDKVNNGRQPSRVAITTCKLDFTTAGPSVLCFRHDERPILHIPILFRKRSDGHRSRGFCCRTVEPDGRFVRPTEVKLLPPAGQSHHAGYKSTCPIFHPA